MDININLINETQTKTILESFITSDVLPQLMQGVSSAVITIQVAFIIAIISGIIAKKERNIISDKYELDIVLDNVWKFKINVIWSIIVFSIPSLLLIHNMIISYITLALWILGLTELIHSLFRTYNWVKSDENKIEESKSYIFSRSLIKNIFRIVKLSTRKIKNIFKKNPIVKLTSWKWYWSQENISYVDEEKFFIEFATNIDYLIDENKYSDISVFLEYLHKFINKRNLFFITHSDAFFPKILEWKYWSWNQEYLIFAKESLIKSTEISKTNIGNTLNEIIKFVTKSALNKSHEYSYFKHLKKHIDTHQDIFIKGEKHDYLYVESLLIYHEILNSLNDWKSFPSEWVITKQNYQKNTITRVWFKTFIEWLQDRRNSHSEIDFDKQIDVVIKGIFPKINISIFSRILHLIIYQYSDIYNSVNNKRNFGFIGHMFMSFNLDNHEEEFRKFNEDLDNTAIDLILFLFKDVIKRDIGKWMSDLQLLDENLRTEKDFWIKILTILKLKL